MLKWEQTLSNQGRMPSLGSSSEYGFYVWWNFRWKTKKFYMKECFDNCTLLLSSLFIRLFFLPQYQNSLPHIFATREQLRTMIPWLAGVLILNWVTLSLFLSSIFPPLQNTLPLYSAVSLPICKCFSVLASFVRRIHWVINKCFLFLCF